MIYSRIERAVGTVAECALTAADSQNVRPSRATRPPPRHSTLDPRPSTLDPRPSSLVPRPSSALLEPHLHVGLVTQLPHPFLVGLVGLACSQCHACVQTLALLGHVLVAPLQHLDQVPAEGRLHRAAHFARL